MNNKKVWIEGEVLAQKYLAKLGYKILDTNVNLAHAEVDIVALCPKKVLIKDLLQEYKKGSFIKSSFLAAKKTIVDTLVFVEVKARTSTEFGLPQEAVTPLKQHKIRRCAEMYANKPQFEHMAIRYDIIAVLNDKLQHIKNAF